MPCPHFSITIVKGSKGQSAVAGAAYDSGQKLYSERDMRFKDYSRRKDVIEEQILLPIHAPPEFKNRELLWNSVEGNEKRFDAQYARRIVAALPIEIPREQYHEMVTEFCEEAFVKKGMCCDFAIHDKGDGNPHVHIMLTMRRIDENGKWMPKSKMVYELDENGNKIRLPSGNYKSHKVNTVDWNDKKYAELWRHSWEEINNRYLEANGRDERLDLRSYKRQGKEPIPMVHMSGVVCGLEKKGVDTFAGSLNREIKEHNRGLSSIKEALRSVGNVISELKERLSEEKKDEDENNIAVIISSYLDQRKEERKDWYRGAQNKGTSKDLKEVSLLYSYLENRNIHTAEEMGDHVRGIFVKNRELRASFRGRERRLREIDRVFSSLETVKELRPVHDKYQGIYWKGRKEKFREEHREELDDFEKANKYLLKRYPERSIPIASLKKEKDRLLMEKEKLEGNLKDIQADIDASKSIVKILREIRPELYETVKSQSGMETKSGQNDRPDIYDQTKTVPVPESERTSIREKMRLNQKKLKKEDELRKIEGSRKNEEIVASRKRNSNAIE